jgi:hypothetical protein
MTQLLLLLGGLADSGTCRVVVGAQPVGRDPDVPVCDFLLGTASHVLRMQCARVQVRVQHHWAIDSLPRPIRLDSIPA